MPTHSSRPPARKRRGAPAARRRKVSAPPRGNGAVEAPPIPPPSPQVPAQAVARDLAERMRRWGVVSWALIGIALVVYGLFRFILAPIAVIFAPLAIALVIVYILNPLVGRLERRGVRRGLAVAVIYVVFVAVITVALVLIVPVITRQIGGFIDQLPDYIRRIVRQINKFSAERGWEFRIRLNSKDIIKTIKDNRETIVSFLGGVRTVFNSLVHVLITVIIGFVLSVYLLLDLPKLQRWIKNAIPGHRRPDAIELGEKVGRALGGFFRGQLLVALFVGVASAVGLTFIKLPFAVLVGVIAGIFNLVPLIGPFIGAIPAVILGLLSGTPSKALWAGVVLLTVQQIDNHIISPNVMGRTVRLHPIIVMLALLAGAAIAGIFGMLVVIPAVAAVKIIVLHFWQRRAEIVPTVAETD